MNKENALIALLLVLEVAAIIALWQWFTAIAAVVIFLSLSSAMGYLGLKGYEKYVTIERKQPTKEIVAVRRERQAHSTDESRGVDVAPVRRQIARPRSGGGADFSGLVERGELAPELGFLMGYTREGEPVRVQRLATTAIAGLSGGGKTVTTLYLMLQMIIVTGGNIRFIVIDPHMRGDTEESLFEKVRQLSPFFLSLKEVEMSVQPDDDKYRYQLQRMSRVTNPNVGGVSAVEWAKLIRLEVERRKEGKKGPVWVVVADEFNDVMEDEEVAREMTGMLKAVSQQARKFGIFGLLIAQDWRIAAIGGSADFRKSIAHVIGHRMLKSSSELILPAEAAKLTETLGVGEIVLYDSGQVKRLNVPYTTSEDAEMVAQFYEPYVEPSVLVRELPDDRLLLPEKSGGSTCTQPMRRLEYDPEELEQVRQLYGEGHTEADIAKIVWNVRSGAAFAEKKLQVRKMLASLMERGV